jgi:hypothetical protein
MRPTSFTLTQLSENAAFTRTCFPDLRPGLNARPSPSVPLRHPRGPAGFRRQIRGLLLCVATSRCPDPCPFAAGGFDVPSTATHRILRPCPSCVGTGCRGRILPIATFQQLRGHHGQSASPPRPLPGRDQIRHRRSLRSNPGAIYRVPGWPARRSGGRPELTAEGAPATAPVGQQMSLAGS